MFSRLKILLFPSTIEFNPNLPFEFLIFYHYIACTSTEYCLALTDITTHLHLSLIISSGMTCTLTIGYYN